MHTQISYILITSYVYINTIIALEISVLSPIEL